MEKNKSTQKTSFWNFIKNYRIEIPIIQRDYAQGRLGKEYLRRQFLTSIREALNGKCSYQLKLDFVYGSTDKQTMLPLDGQQRLTTLWLLHWYIALRAGEGELTEDVCRVLSGFSYETRISSREFCNNLCVPQHFEKFDGNDVVGFITTQTWFYSAWKQDPTIQSMLRMLSGTKINDKNGKDIIDGIEELFKDTTELQFKDYWKKLRSNDAPIVFYFLPLNEFKLTDDLYIKMNARGKQLTSFENFKADLIGYITRQSEDKTLEIIQQKEWNGLMDPQRGMPIKLDTDWTDIFWKNRSKDNCVDEIYFAFINRFFLNELVCQKDGNKKYVFTAKELEEGNSVFSYLYGSESDDTKIEYVGIEKYKDIPLLFLKNLSNTLNRVPSDLNLSSFNPKWVGHDFQYIPIYKDNSISSLEQKDRIVFHAISKYIQEGAFDAVSFRQWIRVVWNIVENAGVNSISSMIGVMRLIDELSIHSHEVYSFLDSQKHGKTITSNAAQDQLNQEMNKAVQILHGEQRSDGETWENIIIGAEQFAFFKGSISFLFQDGDGNPNWIDFDTKWENAKKYFDTDGVKDDDSEGIKYKSEAKLLKYLISNFNTWDDFWGVNFDNSASTWKNILISNRFFSIDRILMSNTICLNQYESILNPIECDNDFKKISVQNELVTTNILEHISKSSKLNWRNGNYCLYPYNTKSQKNVCIIANIRNIILSSLCHEGIITTDHTIENTDYFWGWDIIFRYTKNDNQFVFQWNTDNHVYLVEEGKWVIRDDKIDEKYEKFYCFDTSMIREKEDFRQNLDDLIELVSKDES